MSTPCDSCQADIGKTGFYRGKRDRALKRKTIHCPECWEAIVRGDKPQSMFDKNQDGTLRLRVREKL